MFETGKISFIKDFVDTNVVNVVYRNNDIINFLSDAFLSIGDKFGIDTTNGLSSAFLKLYFGTILLYLIIHIIIDRKNFYKKFFDKFSNSEKLTPKNIISTEFVQMFLLVIMATLFLMPAKMQYVKLLPYNPTTGGVPQYVDLEDSHPKGKEIKTIAIIAWTVWAHNRFVYGIKTSNGPAPVTEIAKFSVNYAMPSIFHKYFTEINEAIDGYVYVYNYIKALKDINNMEEEEGIKYANILDSQLSMSIGMKTIFKAETEKNKLLISNEYSPIFDEFSTGDYEKNRELNALIANVAGHKVTDVFNNWENQNWTDAFSNVMQGIGRIGTNMLTDIADNTRFLTGSSAEAIINRQLTQFDAIDKNGLPLLNAHVDFLSEGHKNNQEYKKMINDYIKYTISGENPIPNAENNCVDTEKCLYLTKLKEANKYLLKDTFARLINLTGIEKDYNGTYPITPMIKVGNYGSGMSFEEFSKIYFDETLAKNQARLLQKIDNLNKEAYPFKKGIRGIFLLSHTNFLQDMEDKNQNSSGYVFSNLGSGSYDVSNIDETNKKYATSILKHSLLVKDSKYDNMTESKLTYKGMYNAQKKDNEVKEIAFYSVNDGLNIKAFLNTEIKGITELKKALDGQSNIVSDTYNQVDNNYNFVGYDSDASNKIKIDFSQIISGNNIQNDIYHFQDLRLNPIFGESLQYITDRYKEMNVFANFLQPITEQLLFEYLFTEKGKLYNNILNYKSGELTQDKLHSYGFTLNCHTQVDSQICEYLEAPDIENFTSPIGTNAYLKYSGTTIQKEIQKLEYIRDAIIEIPLKERSRQDAIRIGFDSYLVNKYLNILKHFNIAGGTGDTLVVKDNDELFQLFKLMSFVSQYIKQKTENVVPKEVTVTSVPPLLMHNLYFYPHAIAYFENIKSSNKQINTPSITNTIKNLYYFVSPKNVSEFTDIFGAFKYNSNTYEITKEKQANFSSGGTPSDDNINIGLARTNFYKNLQLMSDLQEEKIELGETESNSLKDGTLTDGSIASFATSVSQVSLPGASGSKLMAAKSAAVLLSEELADLLFWVSANFANMFADAALKYIIEPYHFIFGKNDFTFIGQSPVSKSVIKGIFENSNNFHMDYIKLNFSVPTPSGLDGIASIVQNYEEEIGEGIVAILGIALEIATGGLAGAALVAIARTVTVLAAKKTLVKGIKRGLKYTGKKMFRRGGQKGTSFGAKNIFQKGWAVLSFLGSAPYLIVSAIIGTLIKTAYLLIIVISAIIGIFRFLIEFVLRIAMPLTIGLIYLVLQALFYPIIYMFKDVLNNVRGSFEEMNSQYLEGLVSTFKTLFKLYLVYIGIVMLFVTIYKTTMGIATYISLKLMFQWQTFNLPISMIVLIAIWLTTWVMGKIIVALVPDGQLAKFNFVKH